MGAQSIEIRDYEWQLEESLKSLTKNVEGLFYEKYFLYKCGDCTNGDNDYLKYKYLNIDNCNIVDYLNKKISGELDHEYRRKKILGKLNRVEFEWECEEAVENDYTKSCSWQEIEW